MATARLRASASADQYCRSARARRGSFCLYPRIDARIYACLSRAQWSGAGDARRFSIRLDGISLRAGESWLPFGRLRRLGGVARIAIDEGRRRPRGLRAGKRHHLAVIGRQRASRVGVARVGGDGHGLAATAAEISILEGARPARLFHPIGAAEGVERLAVEPDVEQLPLLDIVEFETGNGLGGVTGKDLAGRRDVHEAFAPAAHAGLRTLGVIIGNHHVDGKHALEPLPLALDELD